VGREHSKGRFTIVPHSGGVNGGGGFRLEKCEVAVNTYCWLERQTPMLVTFREHAAPDLCIFHTSVTMGAEDERAGEFASTF